MGVCPGRVRVAVVTVTVPVFDATSNIPSLPVIHELEGAFQGEILSASPESEPRPTEWLSDTVAGTQQS